MIFRYEKTRKLSVIKKQLLWRVDHFLPPCENIFCQLRFFLCYFSRTQKKNQYLKRSILLLLLSVIISGLATHNRFIPNLLDCFRFAPETEVKTSHWKTQTRYFGRHSIHSDHSTTSSKCSIYTVQYKRLNAWFFEPIRSRDMYVCTCWWEDETI